MKRFNYEQFLDTYKKKFRLSLIFCCVCSCIITTLFVVGLLISNYHNQQIIMIVFSIMLGLLTLPTVSIYLFGVKKYSNERKQIFYLLGSYLTYHEGKIISINKTITTLCGRKGMEIVLETKNGPFVVYFDPVFGKCPFTINDYIKAKCSESFIIKYEVEND